MGISPKAFAELNQRLAEAPSRSEKPVAGALIQPADDPISILGIDPSLRGTGYGVIQCHGQRLTFTAADTIKCPPKWSHSQCLLQIADILADVIREHQPGYCVVEGLFFAKNLKTALVMGQARGACIVSASRAGLPIYELAARKVKQAIVGYGGAQKIAVAKMVQRLLALEDVPAPDAADALALAIAFNMESRSHVAKPINRI